MGWSHGGEIFDPVCDKIVEKVKGGQLAPRDAEEILTVLIRELRMQDWDDPEESLGLYSQQYVVDAFAKNNIEIKCDDCGEHPDDHCEECGECGCEGECQDEEEE